MTLCIAWKSGKRVYFASDSRLTVGGREVTSEDSPKIFTINVAIYGPDNSGEDEPIQPQYHTTFGMCFTGSYLNGSYLADTISEVLSNIQGSDQVSDFGIANLSDIAFSIYKKVSIALSTIHRSQGFAKVFLAGFCPVDQSFRLYKFSPISIETEGVEFQKEPLELDSGPLYLGDSEAIKLATKLSEKINNNYTYFHVLRDVIRNQEILTVGGNIQAGQFVNKKFQNCGIAEYGLEENEYGLLDVIDNYSFRGIPLHLDNNEMRSGNVNIMKPFINPFEHERNENFQRAKERIEEKFGNPDS